MLTKYRANQATPRVTQPDLFRCLFGLLSSLINHHESKKIYFLFFYNRKRKAEDEAEEEERKKKQAEWDKNFEVNRPAIYGFVWHSCT